MSERKPRPRVGRRAAERDAKKLADNLERLALLEPGGSPDSPIELASASQVDVHARDARCVVCGGLVRLEDHTAETLRDVRLRVAHVQCQVCGRKRKIFFKLVSTTLN